MPEIIIMDTMKIQIKKFIFDISSTAILINKILPCTKLIFLSVSYSNFNFLFFQYIEQKSLEKILFLVYNPKRCLFVHYEHHFLIFNSKNIQSDDKISKPNPKINS